MLMRKVVLVQESAWVSWLLGPVPPVPSDPSDPSDEAEPPAALRPVGTSFLEGIIPQRFGELVVTC